MRNRPRNTGVQPSLILSSTHGRAWVFTAGLLTIALSVNASAQAPRDFQAPVDQFNRNTQQRLQQYRDFAPRTAQNSAANPFQNAPVPTEQRPSIPGQRPSTPAQQPSRRSAGDAGGAGFDRLDPTQTAPDMRRLLEGEQEEIRREPPPPIEVVGKVVGARGNARALLRINGRYFMVEKGTRFSLPSSTEPQTFSVNLIDSKGIEIEGGEPRKVQRLQ